MSVPLGSIIAWVGDLNLHVPIGYLPCTGTVFNRIDYPELYALLAGIRPDLAIGEAQCRTPNFQGRFLRCMDISGELDRDRHRQRAGLLSDQKDEFKRHNHAHGSSEHNGAIVASPRSHLAGGNINHAVSRFAIWEEGEADETRPLNVAVHYLIKARRGGEES